jgi:hypothetical protein
MALQEHLIRKQDDIHKMIDDIIANDDEKVKLDK